VLAPVRDLVPRRNRGRERDRAHVAAHYDLSNDFFSLMLDPSMAYSCALFDDPAASLEDAQRAKFDRVFQLLDVSAGDRLLEIGTGWGGLAVHAASTRGCRVTTTTISANQHEHTRKRVAELDLDDRIEILDADYRDLDGTYDKVVSIEMIEAVDWRDHAAFFSAVADRLRPGGRAAIQAIVIDDRSYERAKRHTDFIKAAIFPGGCLPSVSSIIRSARDAGLVPVEVHRIGHHYPETLRRWQDKVDAHRREIVQLGFDGRFLRTWRFYLQYCIGSFEAGHIDDVHVVLQKG
jgi:cyclopropane-fatty-acyl-phospholipid synthase